MNTPTTVLTLWTSDDTAQIVFDGPADVTALERLERLLDQLLLARATHLTVHLARLEGTDVGVLKLLAAHGHRLRARQGCLHVDGVAARLITSPEVAALPELFGPIPGPPPQPLSGPVAREMARAR